MQIPSKRERARAKRLRCIFDYVNEQCFEGKLEVGRIGFRVLPKALAMVVYFGDGRQPIIWIHSRLRWSLKLCGHQLLHEMVHMGNRDVQHGEEMELEIIKLKRVACLDGDAY